MTKKLYGHTRARDLDSYYDHISAMTGEELHSKADIACELAWRDEQIDVLRKNLDAAALEMRRAKKTPGWDSLGFALRTRLDELFKILEETKC